MKKIIVLTIGLAFTLVSLPAFAIDLPLEALKAKDCKVPASYAKVVKVDDKEDIVFGSSGTFYGPSSLNNILNAYK